MMNCFLRIFNLNRGIEKCCAMRTKSRWTTAKERKRQNPYSSSTIDSIGTRLRMLLLLLLHAFLLLNGVKMFNDQGRITEMLLVTVRPGDMPRYLQLDQRIWTAFLQRQDGFVSKRDLLSTHQPTENATEVYHLIEWASFEQWKNIAADELQQTDERFVEAFGYEPELRALPNGEGFRTVQPEGR